ncbi:MAG: shikimate kinase [Massilibacteroides sp.]|nr:shikimate kinase [Massilibacteroides sp.]MDD3062128.1 shikimate kinase [Massilibacteroides sp.]MDD4114704.1 shikimate kinase [Massilibacteroides sp.]MDD4660311.1 shikimate kinase [Massilibacteroides sp.]
MKRIFLIGYMGAGKTTVGKRLASQMGLSFIDLDSHIENRYYKTVRELFVEKGEDIFREIEKKMLHEVADFEDVLVSTGGGCPCFFDNMAFMNTVGTTVYLKVSIEELAKRLEICKQSRPVLQNRSDKSLFRFIEENMQKRRLYYEQASLIFDAEKMLTESDVQTITIALERILSE